MAKRNYSFEHLTDKELDALAAMYPKSVETVTIRKPVYKILAMLAECGAALPEGVSLVVSDGPGKPPFLKGMGIPA